MRLDWNIIKKFSENDTPCFTTDNVRKEFSNISSSYINKTLMEMVNHTRLDCSIGTAGIMRQALAQALHNARNRKAFDLPLSDQPLMQNVLADLALESEAATTMIMHVVHFYDELAQNISVRPLARLATAITKFWICKRAPNMVYEALECLGGSGYVEECILPRMYREAPVNSVWEGSGNVIVLDAFKTVSREPESLPAFLQELGDGRLPSVGLNLDPGHPLGAEDLDEVDEIVQFLAGEAASSGQADDLDQSSPFHGLAKDPKFRRRSQIGDVA